MFRGYFYFEDGDRRNSLDDGLQVDESNEGPGCLGQEIILLCWRTVGCLEQKLDIRVLLLLLLRMCEGKRLEHDVLDDLVAVLHAGLLEQVRRQLILQELLEDFDGRSNSL
jgi:hypothetical protein